MTEPAAAPPAESGVRVSTLELFFDLVFVFTITQLTETLAEHVTLATLGDVLLMLFVIWWMYSGYAWLTNAVAPNSTTRRTLLLAGMAGFLVMALTIPEAFGEYGWLFGVSYLVVNLVHSALFLQAGPGARRAMRQLAPLNILAALLVLAGGLLPEPYRHLCWIAAPLVQIAAGYLHDIEMHSIMAGHFAERHGLVMIVAIGEALALGGGVAVYQLGHAIFLRLLGVGGWLHRVVAALVVLATVPLGHVRAVAQLAVSPLIMAAAAIIEDLPRIRRDGGSTAISSFGRTPGS